MTKRPFPLVPLPAVALTLALFGFPPRDPPSAGHTAEVEDIIATAPYLPFDESASKALRGLVQSALARNPAIKAMEERVVEAGGLHRQSSLRPNPTLDIEGDTDLETGNGTDRGLSVGYSHVFETAGKRWRRMDVASQEIRIKEFQLAERKRDVVGQLRGDFLRALVLDRAMAAQREIAEITKSLLDIVRERVREGETPAIALKQASVESSRAAVALRLLEGRRRGLLESLRTLAGLDAGAPVTVEGAISPRKLAPSEHDLVTQAMQSRPDLKGARAELSRVEAEIELLKAQRVPDIVGTLKYSYSRSGFELNGLDAAGNQAPIRDLDHALSVGIALQLPVRDRNQGKLAAAAARLRSLRLEVRVLEASIRREVTVACQRYKAALDSLDIFQDQILDQARSSVNALQEAYQLGEIPLSDVLNEERRLAELQREYNDVILEYAEAAADLARADAASTP